MHSPAPCPWPGGPVRAGPAHLFDLVAKHKYLSFTSSHTGCASSSCFLLVTHRVFIMVLLTKQQTGATLCSQLPFIRLSFRHVIPSVAIRWQGLGLLITGSLASGLAQGVAHRGLVLHHYLLQKRCLFFANVQMEPGRDQGSAPFPEREEEIGRQNEGATPHLYDTLNSMKHFTMQYLI